MSKKQTAYWRMTFRPRFSYEDSEEAVTEDVWAECLTNGCARIWAGPLRDLSDVAERDFPGVWASDWVAERETQNTTLQGSIRKFRYEMEEGDIIYVKGTLDGTVDGKPGIVGKGRIVGPYKWDDSAHIRAVKWDSRFPAIPSTLVPETMKAPHHTIRPLRQEHVAEIEAAQ